MLDSEILSALESWYKGRILSLVLSLICIIVFVVFIILISKYVLTMPKHFKLIILCGVCIISIVIAILLFIPFRKVQNDYSEKEYIVEKNAMIYVYEDNAPFFNHYTDVKLLTSGGDEIMLKLRLSHDFSYKKSYRGDFAYTKNSKELILYEIIE